ncbi:hypothetical protein SLITO_v1c01120 [Spiroplasma litorale]|uniref:Uncharacterized protein n=1 Tax=Spiroplasma litorale TaxID=216942 RepID=A0A0K1W0F4_9MOLU|nr:hypothetical protein [Spiroplasma litorale]AKX33780.1 hypothetical protein SLITO_v1c01120 [Spiroplasma litorale]
MKPDNLCKAGCIVSIIGAAIAMITFVGLTLLFILTAVSGTTTPTSSQNSNDLGVGAAAGTAVAIVSVIAAIFLLALAALQIPTLVLCAKILKGTASSKTAAGVVSIIFSGLIGGILILCGNYGETNEPISMDSPDITNE